jgi:hypothetical protein
MHSSPYDDPNLLSPKSKNVPKTKLKYADMYGGLTNDELEEE